MKLILVSVLLGLIAISSATSTYEKHDYPQETYHSQDYEDHDFLKRYQNVLTLFKYVHQTSYDESHVAIAQEYSIENNSHLYTNSQAIEEFVYHYKQGFLPKDEVFSVFYEFHLKQAISLFKLFYYAKDFETFYKTAVWARYHINQGMFLYSYSVALIHRPDTYKMVLPPIYEIYPYYFFNAEVLQKAQQFKQMVSDSDIHDQKYVIYANYSGHYLNLHPEEYLSYFTEDVGINAYYYYYNLYRPFWLDSKFFHTQPYQRGVEFYYFHQQLLARFYLERLSNGFSDVSVYDYEDAFETGYYSSLRYQNGLQFSERPNWAKFFTNYYNHLQKFSNKGAYPFSYYKVVDYERRIRDAIDAGFIYTKDGEKINLFEPHGFNVLNNIVESNADSINSRYYGHLLVFARHLLGYSFQPLHKYQVAPSVLEHFETSLRDPAFWQLYKRIISYLQVYKAHLPRYSKKDLIFPGVKIVDVHVDRLLTYFDYYNIDITNAVYMNKHEFNNNKYAILARQYRLNHKPFAYKITVDSQQPIDAVVRVFIGPKYDEWERLITIDENRLNFVEFDRFKYNLKSGENIIERNSRQLYFSNDRTSYKQLYQQVMSGSFNVDSYSHSTRYSLPNRLLLPRGRVGGQAYQFYVIVTPYKTFDAKNNFVQSGDYSKYPLVGLGVPYLDSYPLGYPFDRPIDEYAFYVPNGYFKDVTIYHERNDAFEHQNYYYKNQHYGYENRDMNDYENQYYNTEKHGYENAHHENYGNDGQHYGYGDVKQHVYDTERPYDAEKPLMYNNVQQNAYDEKYANSFFLNKYFTSQRPFSYYNHRDYVPNYNGGYVNSYSRNA